MRSAQNRISSELPARNVCLSAAVPAFAEPDIHLLSRALGPSQKIEFVFSANPETIRREPLEFDLLRSVGHLQDLAVCALCHPVIFLSPAAAVKPPSCCGSLQARSPVVGDPRPAGTRPSSGLRPGSRGFRFPSASLFHGSGPAHGSVGEPVSRLRPGHAGYACCVVWKAVFAGPCPRNSFLLRTTRNS